jgi:uncharacterized SAM-binding protein YcdF (DUF218 family)
MTTTFKAGIILLLISLSALFYAHVHFCYNTFYKPAYLFSQAVKSGPLDVIIVPGIASYGGKWNFVMKWRVNWSVYLYKAGLTKNIIYSGGAVYSPYTEAVIMSLYAEKLGVPKEHIFVEINAEHTTENLYYSWQLAKEKGFNKIAFATDPFQTYKIEPYIKKFNLDVTLLPSVVSIMEGIAARETDIESFSAYKLNFKSINERETKEEQEFYSKGGRIRIDSSENKKALDIK